MAYLNNATKTEAGAHRPVKDQTIRIVKTIDPAINRSPNRVSEACAAFGDRSESHSAECTSAENSSAGATADATKVSATPIPARARLAV